MASRTPSVICLAGAQGYSCLAILYAKCHIAFLSNKVSTSIGSRFFRLISQSFLSSQQIKNSHSYLKWRKIDLFSLPALIPHTQSHPISEPSVGLECSIMKGFSQMSTLWFPPFVHVHLFLIKYMFTHLENSVSCEPQSSQFQSFSSCLSSVANEIFTVIGCRRQGNVG